MDYKNVPQGWLYVDTMTIKEAKELGEPVGILLWCSAVPVSVEEACRACGAQAVVAVLCRPKVTEAINRLLLDKGYSFDATGDDVFSCFRVPKKGEWFVTATNSIMEFTSSGFHSWDINGGRRFIVIKKDQWSYNNGTGMFCFDSEPRTYSEVLAALNEHARAKKDAK